MDDGVVVDHSFRKQEARSQELELEQSSNLHVVVDQALADLVNGESPIKTKNMNAGSYSPKR